MRLFPEVLATFATGCDGWDWHEDALRLARMPKVMRPIYEATENAHIRMLCTSGCRLRFTSDTTRLWLQTRHGMGARLVFKSALLVDGQPADSFGPDALDESQLVHEWEGVIFESPESKMRTFDIWLPHMSRADVVEMQVDDFCDLQPAAELPIRWLAYGDSITQGMTASLPTKTATGIAALACNAELINVAIGGAVLDAALATSVPPGKFDIISMAYGTNDFRRVPLNQYIDNARALLDALAQAHPQTPVLLITTINQAPPEPTNAQGNVLADYRDALAKLADDRPGVTVVDGTTVITTSQDMFVDQVHPNDAGFAMYGNELAKHIQQALMPE